VSQNPIPGFPSFSAFFNFKASLSSGIVIYSRYKIYSRSEKETDKQPYTYKHPQLPSAGPVKSQAENRSRLGTSIRRIAERLLGVRVLYCYNSGWTRMHRSSLYTIITLRAFLQCQD